VFGNHGLCGLPEEGAHEKSPKCLGWEFRGFWGILQRSQVALNLAFKFPTLSHHSGQAFFRLKYLPLSASK
ncbi:hypothetical protein QZH63_10850, partial [Eikenella corrodens]|nr:hypothetical protein [Eikenella corrodens]